MIELYKRLEKKLRVRLGSCSFLIMDFDGVMTDNLVWVDSNGKESVCCSRYDGLGLSMLRANLDIQVAIVSMEKNSVVAARTRKLKVDCFQGINRKADFIRKEIIRRGLRADQSCYVGNDLNDLECFSEVGVSIAVADADPRLIKKADYVTKLKGGRGAIREICELLMFAKKAHPFTEL